MNRLLLAIPALVVLIASGGCASAPKRPYETVTPASVVPGSGFSAGD